MKGKAPVAMIEIDGTIVSLDVLEEKFFCDLDQCKGYCCVHGQSGAPLEDREVSLLQEIYPDIRPFLRKEGIRAIEKHGTSVRDADEEMVTPLIRGRECAYAIFEEGIARCGIEKAYESGMISLKKPLSCHLYPLRIKQYRDFEAVNYDRWSICDPARILGKRKNIRVLDFVRDALIRKYGPAYFEKLVIVKKEFTGHAKDVL